MNKRLSLLLASTGLLFALSLAAACSSSSSTTTSTPVSTAVTSPSAATGATVHTSLNATLGKTVLVNSTGSTLYTYANDTSGTSNCAGSCATAWPPLPPGSGALTGSSGATGTLATITRSDGTKQVTYNGKPLYTFQGDSGAGAATGDGVNSFSVAVP